MERISTGIKELDQILHGGFPKGSSILIVGRPGAGKTVLAHQMVFRNATLDGKILYFTTLAEPLVKVVKYQQEFSFFDNDKFQSCVIYQDLGSVLRKHGVVKALALIDELLKKHEPNIVVIDSIKTISDILYSILECREFLLDLSLRLTTWGCTTLLLAEYSEEDIEVRPEGAIADGIIFLSGAEEKKWQKRFLRILKMRGTSYTGGEIVFRITEKGIELFPRLNPTVSKQEYEHFEERISTGIPGLDEMTGGGIPLGSTTLISGSSGTGKTIIALHFAYAGLQCGEDIAYVTFEENPRQIIKGSILLGLNLQPYIDGGQLHIMHVSPIELNVDEHVYHIQRIARESGAKRMIIDSISSFEIGMENKEKYTDYIWGMTDYFKKQGISVFLTHEMRNSDDISKFTKHGISYIADNLLLLRFIEQGMDIKRYLRVLKMRGCNHSTEMRLLHIDSKGVTLGENTNP